MKHLGLWTQGCLEGLRVATVQDPSPHYSTALIKRPVITPRRGAGLGRGHACMREQPQARAHQVSRSSGMRRTPLRHRHRGISRPGQMG